MILNFKISFTIYVILALFHPLKLNILFFPRAFKLYCLNLVSESWA